MRVCSHGLVGGDARVMGKTTGGANDTAEEAGGAVGVCGAVYVRGREGLRGGGCGA